MFFLFQQSTASCFSVQVLMLSEQADDSDYAFSKQTWVWYQSYSSSQQLSSTLVLIQTVDTSPLRLTVQRNPAIYSLNQTFTHQSTSWLVVQHTANTLQYWFDSNQPAPNKTTRC